MLPLCLSYLFSFCVFIVNAEVLIRNFVSLYKFYSIDIVTDSNVSQPSYDMKRGVVRCSNHNR